MNILPPDSVVCLAASDTILNNDGTDGFEAAWK